MLPGQAHHLTHRGNNKRDVFIDDEDRSTYLGILRKQSTKFALRVLAHCLMANHVHVIAIPDSIEHGFSGFGRTSQLYSLYFHRKYHEEDHLWKHRFHSVLMDQDHLMQAIGYVERNPVCAGLYRFAWEYPWSSAIAHISGHDPFEILDMQVWSELFHGTDWPGFLVRESDSGFRDALHHARDTGVPMGTAEFRDRIAKETGIATFERKIGRPRARHSS